MRAFRLFLSVILILSVFSCAPISNEIKTPPIKIYKAGYGFTPFNEPGWIINNPNDKFAIEIAKQGPTPNSTYAIQIFPEKIPLFDKEDSFYAYVISNYLAQESSPRFEIINISAQKYENDKTLCVELHFKSIDKDPVKREQHSGDMILESHGYMCRHPETNDIGYFINFSHRYHKDEASISVEEIAQKVLNNFDFVEFYY